MTLTKTIPVERLRGLDILQGDTLHIVSLVDSAFLVQIDREDKEAAPERGKAAEWLRTARGSVQIGPEESVDDMRMAYYAEKYGIGA